MSRHQEGYIWRKGHSWYGRWWDDVIEDGRIVRKQRSRRLAIYCDRYRSEKDVRPLLEDILRPINEGRASPQSTLMVAEYVEIHYLPYAQENYKPSTYAGYKTLWNLYLVPRLRNVALRDFRTVDAAILLADLHRAHALGRNTLKHIKSLLSGVFTYAKNQGVLDGLNPIRDAFVPKKSAGPRETFATSPDDVLKIIDILATAGHLKASAAVALIFFAGLRPGEARGAGWDDYDGKCIVVRHAVWRTFTTSPKTPESSQPVPVIEPLRSILTELRKVDGDPESGPILRGPSSKPLNLDNLSRRVVIPTLKAAGLEWHGWYSLRRGIGTLVHTIEKNAMAAKGLLRHCSVTTTQRHYIKDVPEITLNAMKKVEALCNDRATALTAKPS
ncbi:MAG TPA: hypothetical protein VGR03_06050 [Candidatus Acidoferrum sp.]|nr:hypothetical protein [Candidatus Acidoferrum sp.]